MDKISANQLTPNTFFFVRGKVMYSHIASLTTDAEREAENARRKNSFPIDKNYTSIRLCDAQVFMQNPASPTLAEQYAQQHLYVSTSAAANGKSCFNAMNKGTVLPAVYVQNPSTKSYDPVTLEAELATGLDVTIAMRVFSTKGGKSGRGNNGVTLAQVYVNEPLRTFAANKIDTAANQAAMAQLGIVFSAAAPGDAPAPAQANEAQFAQPAQTGFQQAPAPQAQPQGGFQQAQQGGFQQPQGGFQQAPAPQAPPQAEGNIFNANGGASPFQSPNRQY